MTFARFWPAYVAEHRSRLNRRLHLSGSIGYLALLIALAVTHRWAWVWTVPLLAYGFAWTGHFLVEKNRPATFKHPWLSLIGDHKMAALMLAGRMDDEMERLKIVGKP
ncbi:MAG TPA: DUF962 domain-containing protein [Holophagaceae bacterium]|jgi:hypothetical protein|nr:DUF962 domain-containing protein [Holophagaceae bacterium]